jgi:SAM-dependent methyltransferase
MTTTELIPDETAIEAFAGRLLGLLTGGMLAYMIDLGHRTGLFDTLAAGPGTSEELADRASLHERYVREWLGALVTGGIVDYDPARATYHLPAAHAVCLAGTGAMNMAPYTQLNTHLAKYVGQVADAFRDGGGVPYAAYRPEFTDVMDALGRGSYDALLVDALLPLAPGLTDRLRAGARVADVACGTGHALVLLAQAFPTSTFVGYDLDDGAISRARDEAASLGLANVSFEVRDAARLRVDRPFDVVFVFDAIHDQADPAGVLARIRAALAPDGILFAKEPRVSSNLEDNVGNPFAPMLYSVSTLHCMTVSLAEGGAGLGTAYGEQRARQLLAEAGFGDIVVHDAPGDPLDAVFVARPA